MNTIILLLLSITVAPVFSKSEIFDGICPSAEVDVVQNFNQTQFEGFWYVIERYDDYEYHNTFYNYCARYNYLWNNGNRYFHTILVQTTPEGIPGLFVTSTVEEKEKDSNDGRYEHRYNIFKWQDYRIVDTDYENYAVVWTCLQKRTVNEQDLIVMSRDRFFDINSMESLNATLAKPPFDRSLLKYIEQKSEICNERPIANQSNSIIL